MYHSFPLMDNLLELNALLSWRAYKWTERLGLPTLTDTEMNPSNRVCLPDCLCVCVLNLDDTDEQDRYLY